MKRRDWLRWSMQWGVAATVASRKPWSLGSNDVLASSRAVDGRYLVSDLVPNKWPVTQGATGFDSVQFAIVFKLGEEPTLEFWDSLNLVNYQPFDKQIISREHSGWAVLKLKFRGLPEGRIFRLRVGGVDERVVRLLERGKTRARVAVISCVEDTGKVDDAIPIWRNFAALKPDALFLIGDHVYVDQGKAISGEPWGNRIWRRYAEARVFHEFYYLPELIPVYANWDDHDFGRNNANATAEWKEEAQAVFKAFFAQDADGSASLTAGPGVASAVDFYGIRWILTDDRSWRDQSATNGLTHWGDEQENWVDRMIDSAPGTAFLCNGSQFFGGYLPGESYEKSHADSFVAFRSRLRNRRNRVILVSGDRHFSELMRVSADDVGYETLELTTSGFIQISHLTVPWPFFKNPRRLAGTSESHNFAIIDVEAEGGQARGRLVSRSNKGRVIFEREFIV